MDNPLKVKLARGEPVLGYWSVIASPMLVELFGRAGVAALKAARA